MQILLPQAQDPGLLNRRLPVGAELQPGGGVHFRVWAPSQRSLSVVLASDGEWLGSEPSELLLVAEEGGYFSGFAPQARAGSLYKFRLGSGVFPDPASRFQPEGPHGPSQVIDPEFPWTDTGWPGTSREGQVIYEMHLGTFTKAGTVAAAMDQLAELAELGITLIELMPVADFPGRFGWGYDGVNLFAPSRLYGTPADLRAFVDRAHALGLGVILDVVYNHLGPDGNFLREFTPDYFSTRYNTEWGSALNFDGPHSQPVRELFIANAGYWIDEFHLDGLRLDATDQIYDASDEPLIASISRRVREAAGTRLTFLVAENEAQHVALLEPLEKVGHGMDAMWNDDFHHSAMVALTGKHEAYYSDYRGTPQEFVAAAKHGYLYQGQWYGWQSKARGTPSLDFHPARFVAFIQNHDQVANSLRGQRVHELTCPAALRAMTALLLLGPATPMLFQGQEFAATSPFLYFADHQAELAELVAKGRLGFLAQFPSVLSASATTRLAPPHAQDTFRQCKLDFSERESHAPVYQLHRDLLRLRRSDPVFRHSTHRGIDGAVLGADAFVLRYFSPHGDRLLLVNLGADLELSPAPEPLLAPPADSQWNLLWSSEHPTYGGNGTLAPPATGPLRLPAHSATALAASRPAAQPPRHRNPLHDRAAPHQPQYPRL